MELQRVELYLDCANNFYKQNKLYKSFKCCLDGYSVLPDEYSIRINYNNHQKLQRDRIEAFLNETLGNIYFENANKKLFKMNNAPTTKDMQNNAFKLTI